MNQKRFKEGEENEHNNSYGTSALHGTLDGRDLCFPCENWGWMTMLRFSKAFKEFHTEKWKIGLSIQSWNKFLETRLPSLQL